MDLTPTVDEYKSNVGNDRMDDFMLWVYKKLAFYHYLIQYSD